MEAAFLEFIRESNAKTEAWVAEDPGNRWAGLLSEDPAHWESRGISTVEEFQRDEMLTFIYDATKSTFGYRPNMERYNAMSFEELSAAADRLSEEVNEEMDRELNYQIDRFIGFEQRISHIQDLMGNSREDALRILTDAEGKADDIEFYGYSALEFELNIEYGSIKKWLEE